MSITSKYESFIHLLTFTRRNLANASGVIACSNIASRCACLCFACSAAESLGPPPPPPPELGPASENPSGISDAETPEEEMLLGSMPLMINFLLCDDERAAILQFAMEDRGRGRGWRGRKKEKEEERRESSRISMHDQAKQARTLSPPFPSKKHVTRPKSILGHLNE